MDQLTVLMLSIKFSDASYDSQGHRAIYNLLSSLAPSDPSSTPPPSLIFYAARNILFPSFILGQIPDLLNLLSAIDVYRRFSALKADEALEWQKYYQNAQKEGRHGDVRTLTDKESRRLREFVAKKGGHRKEYVLLVRSLVQLYIYYLWTAAESCLLGKRLNDFFPGSIEGIDKPSSLLFHVDLSDEEAASFMQLKDECQRWMNLVVDWESRREARGEEQGYDSSLALPEFPSPPHFSLAQPRAVLSL
ncbi:hypothetical protein PAXINDRAFT_156750 [Paxillus involutus ATCC 200175]|uniref:Uncharacterized protein n=1 Tax=Paxillus involutus ATCC 200175 TaxID=664439 RepID=A0A0C9SUK1_PAXIN|nr:hypothetical protein PAXINDRAFT_156750 [Paxillus involutus ATCC 200175]